MALQTQEFASLEGGAITAWVEYDPSNGNRVTGFRVQNDSDVEPLLTATIADTLADGTPMEIVFVRTTVPKRNTYRVPSPSGRTARMVLNSDGDLVPPFSQLELVS